MKRLGFFSTAILLQVLILLVPGHYAWVNVGGLFVFSIVYCFHSWLEYCTNKEELDTEKRLASLEKEIREVNSVMQWKDK